MASISRLSAKRSHEPESGSSRNDKLESGTLRSGKRFRPVDALTQSKAPIAKPPRVFSKLPFSPEILLRIMGLGILSPRDRAALKATCNVACHAVRDFESRSIQVTSSDIRALFDGKISEVPLDIFKERIRAKWCLQEENPSFEVTFNPHIDSLDLSDLDISGEQLEALIGLFPNLQELNLRSIDDEQLKAVVRLSPYLQKLILQGNTQLIDISCLTELKYLTHLDLSGCIKITDEYLQNLQPVLQNLKELYLNDCHQITAVGFAALTTCRQLEILNLSWCTITDTSLLALKRAGVLLNLKQLHLHYCYQITDVSCETLITCRQLEELDLSLCAITDIGLLALKRAGVLQNLKHLNLRGCHQITGIGFAALTACRQLETLNLARSNITDADLLALQKAEVLKNLKCLDLENCHQITAVGFAALTTCRQLEILNLSWCKITDAGLLTLQKAGILKNLKEFYLQFCRQITDIGFAALTACKQLEILHLARNTITNESLLALQKAEVLKNLKKLNLDACLSVTVAGFAVLSECRQLEVLSLFWCTITDEDLLTLQKAGVLQNLKKLYLQGCRRITAACCESLKVCKQLTTLKLSDSLVTDADLLALQSLLPNLLR